MQVDSKTFIRSFRTIHMGYGSTVDFKDIESSLSKTMTNKLLKYALNRLDEDLKELVITKQYKVVIERFVNSDDENLSDSNYQVNFISKKGLMISVDYILLKGNNKPFLDHGTSLAEGQ